MERKLLGANLYGFEPARSQKGVIHLVQRYTAVLVLKYNQKRCSKYNNLKKGYRAAKHIRFLSDCLFKFKADPHSLPDNWKYICLAIVLYISPGLCVLESAPNFSGNLGAIEDMEDNILRCRLSRAHTGCIYVCSRGMSQAQAFMAAEHKVAKLSSYCFVFYAEKVETAFPAGLISIGGFVGSSTTAFGGNVLTWLEDGTRTG